MKIDNKKPKIWKMLLIAWTFAFIVINLFFASVGHYIQDFHPLFRSVITTTVFVPVFGLGIPFVQGKLRTWTTD